MLSLKNIPPNQITTKFTSLNYVIGRMDTYHDLFLIKGRTGDVPAAFYTPNSGLSAAVPLSVLLKAPVSDPFPSPFP